MQPATRSRLPLHLLEHLNQAEDIVELANQILECVNQLVPLQAALRVTGNSASLVNPHGFPVELLNELQSRCEGESTFLKKRPGEIPPTALTDGAQMYVFPLVHAGSLEAILYLSGNKESGGELSHQQLKDLARLCDLSAQAIAQRKQAECKSSEAHISIDLPADMTDPSIAVDPLPVIASRLMGTIAHDLRTPVTVIRGYLKMMLSERMGPVTQDQKECLEGAMNSMNQLTSLAGMIGDVSGLMEQIHPELLNVQDDLLRRIWEEVQPQATEKGIVLGKQFPVERLMVCGDRRILCDVIGKLIVRSVGLADRNTGISIVLSSRKSGDSVLKITFTCSSGEASGHNVVSELHMLVFLHGGKLTFSTDAENRSSYTLFLPGKDA